jgi:hypothetical protein
VIVRAEPLEGRCLFASGTAPAPINYGGFRIADGSTRIGFVVGTQVEDLLLQYSAGPYAGITSSEATTNPGPVLFDQTKVISRTEPRNIVALGDHFLEHTDAAIAMVQSSSTGPGVLRTYRFGNLTEEGVYSSARFNADYLRIIPLDFTGNGFTDLAVIYGPEPGVEYQTPVAGAHVWIMFNDGKGNLSKSITLTLPNDFTGAISSALIPGAAGFSLVAGEASGKIDVISMTKSGATNTSQFSVDAGAPVTDVVAGDLRGVGYDDILAVTGRGFDSNGHLTGSVFSEVQSDKNGNLSIGSTFTEAHKVIIPGMASFGYFGGAPTPGFVYTGLSTSSSVLQDTQLLTLNGNGGFQSQEIWYSGGEDEDLVAIRFGLDESIIFEYAQTEGPGSAAPPSTSLYELGDLDSLLSFPLASSTSNTQGILPPFPSDASDSVSQLYLSDDGAQQFSLDPNPSDADIPILYYTTHRVLMNVYDREGDLLEQMSLAPDAKHEVEIPTDNDPASVSLNTQYIGQAAVLRISYDY